MSYVGNKAQWQKSREKTYSSASSFLIPSQAFRRFCLTPLWLSHLPEGRHQSQYPCKLCLDKVDMSKPTKLTESRNLLFSPVPLRVARDFPKLVSLLFFLQPSAKKQKHKELLKLGTCLIFHFSFSRRLFYHKHTHIILRVEHLFLKSLVRCLTFAISIKPEDSIPMWSITLSLKLCQRISRSIFAPKQDTRNLE